MKELLDKILYYPLPWRLAFFRKLRRIKNKISLNPYKERLDEDEVDRPHYGYCIYNAAKLAKALGHSKISIIELGVAGGNGLVNIEYHIKEIQKEIDIDFEVYGFDNETGLPKSNDYRDCLYAWDEGYFKMDKEKLESKLKISKLVIGDVNETCSTFFQKYKPAPIGCVLVDLDYYSSTMNAFKIFEADSNNYLPRVLCYFDDILGLNEYLGELAAIHEFNKKFEYKKIAKIYSFQFFRKYRKAWNEQIFCFHDFKHPQYNTSIKKNPNSFTDLNG